MSGTSLFSRLALASWRYDFDTTQASQRSKDPSGVSLGNVETEAEVGMGNEELRWRALRRLVVSEVSEDAEGVVVRIGKLLKNFEFRNDEF